MTPDRTDISGAFDPTPAAERTVILADGTTVRAGSTVWVSSLYDDTWRKATVRHVNRADPACLPSSYIGLSYAFDGETIPRIHTPLYAFRGTDPEPCECAFCDPDR